MTVVALRVAGAVFAAGPPAMAFPAPDGRRAHMLRTAI